MRDKLDKIRTDVDYYVIKGENAHYPKDGKFVPTVELYDALIDKFIPKIIDKLTK
jgi:hypothetical protein